MWLFIQAIYFYGNAFVSVSLGLPTYKNKGLFTKDWDSLSQVGFDSTLTGIRVCGQSREARGSQEYGALPGSEVPGSKGCHSGK